MQKKYSIIELLKEFKNANDYRNVAIDISSVIIFDTFSITFKWINKFNKLSSYRKTIKNESELNKEFQIFLTKFVAGELK